MANRWLDQFFYSFVKQPVFLTGSFNVGNTGAVSKVVGGGIASITRLTIGVYRIVPQDKFNLFFWGKAMIIGGTGGSVVNAGSFVTGNLYQIVTLGTTTTAQWQAAGVPAGVTPVVGLPFVATGAGAGNGTVKAVAPSGIYATELAGDPNLAGSLATPAQGLILACYGPTATANTALVLTDPAAGSIVKFGYILRNSSVKTGGQ